MNERNILIGFVALIVLILLAGLANAAVITTTVYGNAGINDLYHYEVAAPTYTTTTYGYYPSSYSSYTVPSYGYPAVTCIRAPCITTYTPTYRTYTPYYNYEVYVPRTYVTVPSYYNPAYYNNNHLSINVSGSWSYTW